MTQAAIFGPFFATVFLTFLVWVYMYARPISFITTSKISPKDLAVPGALARLGMRGRNGVPPAPPAILR